MASTYATFTPGTSTNNNKFTMSVWVKRAKITGDYQAIYVSHISGGGGAGLGLFIGNDDSVWYNSGTSSSAFQNTSTSAKLRDLSGWYHIVVAGDTTQSGTDKLKIWINNEQQTSFGNDNRSSFAGLSYDLGSATYANQLGRKHDGSYYLEGVLSHFHFIDGTAYTPSTFGSTDSTTGEWKINTSPSVTYGNNGFFLFKDDNSLNDDSGQGNNFTLGGGTLTKTEDNPSNIFATFNPLVRDAGSTELHHGNTQQNVNTANWRSSFSTLGMTTGKYYFEAYKEAGSHGMIGIRGVEQCDGSLAGNNDHIGVVSQGWALYNADGVVKNNNSDVGSSIGTYANGDYMGCFLDCDNSKLYFSKNGTMLNTTGYSITAGLTYMFGVSGHSTYRWVCNFGNGAFGATQLTGTTYNGSDGHGIFKYSPNNITLDGSSKSFKALSTKGLNS